MSLANETCQLDANLGLRGREPLVCRNCKRSHSPDSFRPRNHRWRHRVCNACHAAFERLRRQARLTDRRNRLIDEFVRDANRRPHNRGLSGLVNRMIAGFGGVDDLAAAWSGRMKQLADTGSPKVLASFQVIAKLLVLAHETRPVTEPALPTAESLDNDALKAELAKSIAGQLLTDEQLFDHVLKLLASKIPHEIPRE